MGTVGCGGWRQYVSVGIRKGIDVVWMLCYEIKGPHCLEIGRSDTGLKVKELTAYLRLLMHIMDLELLEIRD